MTTAEALRSIREDWLHYIQKKVDVDFDRRLQIPVGFTREKKRHGIRAVLGRFRLRSGEALNGFLVKTDGGDVYFIYWEIPDREPFAAGRQWVLSFRILEDREIMAFFRDERRMPLQPLIKQVADFHGHLCPELVIGIKACQYALNLLKPAIRAASRFTVVAENESSALDAFQLLLGVTCGNRGLAVLDYGKHNYAFFLPTHREGFRLRLRPLSFRGEGEYLQLAAELGRDRATLDEVADFQFRLDERARHLLHTDPADLFTVGPAVFRHRMPEMPAAYEVCAACGEMVLAEKALRRLGKVCCRTCIEQPSSEPAGRRLH